MDKSAYVGIDIGGTSVRGRIVDADSRLIDQFDFPTNLDYSATLSSIAQALEQHRPQVAGIGIGVATAIENGILQGGGKLSGWSGRNMQSDIQTALYIPTTIINDAEAAALGEAATQKSDFFFMIWGTGVGGSSCLFDSGAARVRPTEVGHMIIDRGSDRMCGCGGYGHLESHIGGGYLEERFGIDASQLNNSQWSELLRELSIGVYNITLVYRNVPIVFGGGVALKQLGEAGRLDELQSYVNELTESNITATPKLSLARYGEESGLIGALYAARQTTAVG